MRIKEGLKLRPLGKEFIVTGEGLAQIHLNKMASLNQSAAYLWQQVEGRYFTLENLTDLLCEKYDVDRDVASADAERLVNSLIGAGIIEKE